MAQYTVPKKYSQLGCGNIQCDTLLTGDVLKRTAHFMESMGFDADAGCKTICNDCFSKLKDNIVKSIMTKVGERTMGTNRFGRTVPLLKKGGSDGGGGTAGANKVDASTNDLAGKKREELEEMRDNLEAMLKEHPGCS